ncbi:MAG TPA: hypothetical protein VHE30_26720 [Polyangiaceae bacterium]|nr:hypothetical protein [Polyangiaceae bacterium]
MRRLPALLAAASCALVVSACVQDNKVEDYVTPVGGAVQPGLDGGGAVAAASACSDLTAALKKKRDDLRCDAPADDTLACPGYVAVGGSLPCDTYVESSVKSCVDRIGAYASCDDFSTKACVITAVTASCHPQTTPEGGPPDASGPDSSPPDATPSDTGAPPAEAGSPDSGPAGDSGPADTGATPVDSGHD